MTNFSFPVLGTWKATALNWSQKLKLLGNAVESYSSLLAWTETWSPQVQAIQAGTFANTDNFGLYIAPPGSDFCLAIGRVNYTASANHAWVDVDLPFLAQLGPLRSGTATPSSEVFFPGISWIAQGGAVCQGIGLAGQSNSTLGGQAKTSYRMQRELSTNNIALGSVNTIFAVIYRIANGGA